MVTKLNITVIAPLVLHAVVALVVGGWLAFAPADTIASMRPAAFWLLAINTVGMLAWSHRIQSTAMRQIRLLPVRIRDIMRGRKDVVIDGADRPDLVGQTFRRLRYFAEKTHAMTNAKGEMERMASTDPLTGLPNRRGLLEFLGKVIGQKRSWIDPGSIGVMHVDLDHFKTINDTLGHDAGDFVLRTAAERMQDTVRETDLIARIGGDEFVIVAPGIESLGALERLAGRLVERFNEAIIYEEEACHVGVSVGIVAGAPRGLAVDPKTLLTNADAALTHAKRAGRGQYKAFNQSLERARASSMDRAGQIRAGLLNDEFVPWFQPMIDLRTRVVTGVEVLSRWNHPDQGVLLPTDFLGVAETHNMIEEIGLLVLERACDAVSSWRMRALVPPTLHVNMTRAQLLAPGAVDKISWILDDAGMAPESVAIELSETSCSGRSVEVIFENLRRFTDLGMVSVLDDFGASTASLNNITILGCSKVKCAAALTRSLDTEVDDRATDDTVLLRTLPMLGQGLGVDFIAKNVESELQVQKLRAAGFHEMQGVALAPPMNPDETLAWLLENAAASTSAVHPSVGQAS